MRLLESGVKSDASTLRLNQTALHISAFAGNTHCLKWLLHCGASVDRQVKNAPGFIEGIVSGFSAGLSEKADDGDQDWCQLQHSYFPV